MHIYYCRLRLPDSDLEYVGQVAQIEEVMKFDDRRQKGRGDLVVKVQRGVYQRSREFLHRRIELLLRIRHVLLENLAVYHRERLGLRKTENGNVNAMTNAHFYIAHSNEIYLTAKTAKCLCNRGSMVKLPAVGFMQETYCVL